MAALPTSVQVTTLSYPATEVLSYSELASRVRGDLPKGEPYVLVGESYSGPLALMLASDGPSFLNVEVDPKSRVEPQVKFGRPNEDAEPLLERKEFLANMLVEPLPASLEK